MLITIATSIFILIITAILGAGLIASSKTNEEDIKTGHAIQLLFIYICILILTKQLEIMIGIYLISWLIYETVINTLLKRKLFFDDSKETITKKLMYFSAGLVIILINLFKRG